MLGYFPVELIVLIEFQDLHVCILYSIHVRISLEPSEILLIAFRLHKGVEYPFLGPPGVRRLLIFRGVSG